MGMILPIGGYLGTIITKNQKSLMKSTDSRIAATSELLQSIRIVKFFSWEESFREKLNGCRTKELSKLKHYITSVMASRLLWWMCPIMVSFSSFFCYTRIAERELDVTTAFTSLALFNMLRFPLQAFPDILVRILEAYVSLQRIQAFLNEEELERHLKPPNNGINAENISSEADFMAAFQNATYAWYTPLQEEGLAPEISFKLSNLNFVIPRNQLTVVCGGTGSGKSSLINALLGEMNKIDGVFKCTEHSIAYAAQQGKFNYRLHFFMSFYS